MLFDLKLFLFYIRIPHKKGFLYNVGKASCISFGLLYILYQMTDEVDFRWICIPGPFEMLLKQRPEYTDNIRLQNDLSNTKRSDCFLEVVCYGRQYL